MLHVSEAQATRTFVLLVEQPPLRIPVRTQRIPVQRSQRLRRRGLAIERVQGVAPDGERTTLPEDPADFPVEGRYVEPARRVARVRAGS